jgi:hypothetical protein
MGAELWYHEAPWHPDPAKALQALQTTFLAQNYDLPTLLPQHLIWARDAVAASKANREPAEVVDLFDDHFRLLEKLNAQPIPRDPQAQIRILRKVYADSGQGICNVLDVEGITEQRVTFGAQRLTQAEIITFVGSDRPTLAQARSAIYNIHGALHRGECVFFPVYDDAGIQPVAWYFVGNTVD